MAAITYTALREIEKTGYLKSGLITLSAAASDDSINDSANGLSGLLIDQWLLASGFATAANNTWFQASINATAAKITTITPPMSHMRMSGVSGTWAITPDTAANRVTGNIELMAKALLVDWTPAVTNGFLGKDDFGSNRDYTFATDSGSTGKLVFMYTNNGSTTRVATSTVAVPFADLSIGWVKATYNTGTGTVQFFTSTDGITFVQLGANVALTAGTIHNGNSSLVAGAAGLIVNTSLNGRLYYAEVRNGIGGPIVAAFDPSRAVRGATTFVASTGETWTLVTSGSPPTIFQGPYLTTEAAGAAVTLTGYKRGLGQSYSLEFYSEMSDRSVKVDRVQQWPQDRSAPETTVYGRDTFINVSVLGVAGALISEAEMPQWREFLASVEGGELFTFDRYGTIAVPDAPVQAMLADDGYSEERITGGASADRRYKLSLKLQLFA